MLARITRRALATAARPITTPHRFNHVATPTGQVAGTLLFRRWSDMSPPQASLALDVAWGPNGKWELYADPRGDGCYDPTLLDVRDRLRVTSAGLVLTMQMRFYGVYGVHSTMDDMPVRITPTWGPLAGRYTRIDIARETPPRVHWWYESELKIPHGNTLITQDVAMTWINREAARGDTDGKGPDSTVTKDDVYLVAQEGASIDPEEVVYQARSGPFENWHLVPVADSMALHQSRL